jgi:hypothetical protein
MPLGERATRTLGLAGVLVYAAFVAWLYVHQPQTVQEVAGGIAAGVGAYHVDQQAFDDGLQFFRQDQFAASRAAFERADPAGQDALTQFYIAYGYYRQGWGRLYDDARLFASGLERVNKAIALAPGGRLRVEDSNLEMRSADELKAELEAGLRTEPADFNPLKVFRRRK